MRVVQLFGREQGEAERFATLNRGHLDANLRSITIYALYFPAIEFLTSLALADPARGGAQRVGDRRRSRWAWSPRSCSCSGGSTSRSRTSRTSSTRSSRRWRRRSGSSCCSTRRRGADEARGVAETLAPAGGASAAGDDRLRGRLVPLRRRRPTSRTGCCAASASSVRPGRDGRARGAHGRGQDDDREPAAPLLRAAARADHGERHRHPGPAARTSGGG